MSPFSPSEFEPITSELDVGERVLWSGQPSPGRMRQKALPNSLVSLPAGVFMAFWIWGASQSARGAFAAGKTPDLGSIVFPAFGLFGVAIVLLMALSPYLEVVKARRTFYALTDRRALVVVDGPKKTVQTVLPSEFSLQRRDLKEGGGDVILKRQTVGRINNEKNIEVGFHGIPNAREVERLARELAQKPR